MSHRHGDTAPRPGRGVFGIPVSALLLVLLASGVVLAAHWPVLSAQAQSFDDEQYFAENWLVRNPSWASAARFFAEVLHPSTVPGYYQPLAMISLMLDAAWGGRPDDLRVVHRTALELHVLNTILMILVLYALFGRPLPAAIAGLLFGVHPMTVEPVAWLAERKTLLATGFSLAAMLCYLRSVRGASRNWRAVSVGFYLLAVLSKPTSTPLPALLLVLDFWPLRRWSRAAVLEKIPYFVIAGVFAAITVLSQAQSGAIIREEGPGVLRAFLQVPYLLVFYLRKIAWPVDLSSVYPLPRPLAIGNPIVLAHLAGALGLLAMIWYSMRRTRALLAGSLFFVIAILPTLGLLKYSWLPASDKYAYLPSLGLLMVLAAGLCELARWPRLAAVSIPACLLLVGAEFWRTRAQLALWQDSERLYRHMLALAPETAQLHCMLGNKLQERGEFDEATRHLHEAIRLWPKCAEAYCNLGIVAGRQGRMDEAMTHLEQAAAILPDNPRVLYNLAYGFQSVRKWDRAAENYRRLLERQADDALARRNLGHCLASAGRAEEAAQQFRHAIQLAPGQAEAWTGLGSTLLSAGRPVEAAESMQEALRLRPTHGPSLLGLGMARMALRDLSGAESCFRAVLEQAPGDGEAHYQLGCLLLARNLPGAAIDEWRRAVAALPDDMRMLNNLAWVLSSADDAGLRNGAEAVSLAERAARLANDAPDVLATLANAYAESGRKAEATATLRRAIERRSASGDRAARDALASRMRLYEQGLAWHGPIQPDDYLPAALSRGG